MNQQPSTGAATTALVLGILGWSAFLGSYSRPGLTGDVGDTLYYHPFTTLVPVILPVLTIILGYVGLQKAQAGAKCHGRSTTALVLGYLLLTIEVAQFVVA